MDLTKFTALSFDCYGTLIDWETGILGVLRPWATECGLDIDDEQLLLAYADHESAAEDEHPLSLYPTILAEAFRRTGSSVGVAVDEAWAARLGESVPDWPSFPDSSAALVTAEDVGAYKPADDHFVALDRSVGELGIERSQLLHVAQSLFHDHVPARRHGLQSVWINRRHDRPGWGATPEPSEEYSYGAEFASMGEFAAAVETAFSVAPVS